MTRDTRRHWDVIVVGAGFAGSLVAHRLGGHGHRVLVLEAGHDVPDAATTAAAYLAAGGGTPTSPYPRSADAPSPDVDDLTGRPDGGSTAAGHLRQHGPLPYASGYLRANGGTGLLWTGLTPRMHPEDFRTADLGHGRNWPIGYQDLEPYYRQAEHELGVAADADQQRTAVGLPIPADYAFPMRAIPATHLDRTLGRALDGRTVRDPAADEDARLEVSTTPHARNGRPTRPEHPAGPLCRGAASCVPACPSGAKYTPLRTQARWAPGVRLRTDAVASRVLVDGTGRATGVEYHADGDTHRAHADLVVLAAHAIENARLLLLSGLANRSDQVGRNLMDHPALLTWGLLPGPTGPYRGPGSTSGLEAFRFGRARARRAPFRIEIGNWGWSWAGRPPQVETAALLRTGVRGKDLRDRLGDRLGRQFSLQFELEQPADPANRVTLDHSRPDRLGLPRPALHYDLSEYVRQGMASARAVSDQLFALLGAEDHTHYEAGPGWPGRLEHDGRPYGYRGAGHGGGTHIMGDSPATSVVDQWQRCWDHPNLYAVGCGSMPSLGTSNPSLTMAALALRSADRAHHDLTVLRGPAVLHGPAVLTAPRPSVPPPAVPSAVSPAVLSAGPSAVPAPSPTSPREPS
ncbi:Choline dehydrogenase [Streptomyces sp. TLI_053]|uniref:GMC family oxidoreductase n=1 Tax=Streptomyces sp. TLI_053 TaxID=1855352 RepID=UPI00087B85DB|nr:GMC family oxidoreductase [Streptomyces sp. TLI_053]SDT82523.1 Choline dehydrogenase [Streptomyces sp. TLI_053]